MIKKVGRLWWWVLVAALAALVVHYLAKQPVEVTVEVTLGPASQGLAALELRYLDGEEELARARFDYSRSRAPEVVPHTVRFPQGDYDVLVDLYYRERVPEEIRTRRITLGENAVRLRRPLFVRGEGKVSLYVAESP